MVSEMESKLKEEFRPYIKFYDRGEYYVKSEAVEQFMIACDKYDLAILGADGTILNADYTTEEPIDMIIDLSDMPAKNWVDYKRKCNDMALEIMKLIFSEYKDILDQVYYSFVLLTQEDYDSTEKVFTTQTIGGPGSKTTMNKKISMEL